MTKKHRRPIGCFNYDMICSSSGKLKRNYIKVSMAKIHLSTFMLEIRILDRHFIALRTHQ